MTESPRMAERDALSNQIDKNGETPTTTGAPPGSYGNAVDDHASAGYDDEQKTCGCIPRVVRGTILRLSDDLSVDIYMNPTTMSMAILIIWGFTIWCATDENSGETIAEWQIWIVQYWTWFYVFSLITMGGFVTWLLFSRFGDIKLGPKDEPPRFGMGSWFAMLFSAGVGVGLYFWGVAEPVWHYYGAKHGDNRYYTDGDNLEMALDAMNVSWFHWGITASSVYCVVGLPLAYFTHVKNAPLKFSSAFVPLLGTKYANGFVGDLIDTFAVVGTMFGVATSLGLGVIQLNAMLNFLNPDSFDNEDTDLRLIIIWIITAFATVSVFTGLDVGIRRLSEGNFAFCLILLIYLFFIVDPFYLTNLFIQTAGYHLQHLLELTFFTDAFQQAGFAEDEDYEQFMSWWTVFYWGWWIAWSPFVGIFIAQISRGRTIREFILGNVFVPTLFTSIWLTVFGGIGLYNELAFDGRDGNYGNMVNCDYGDNTNITVYYSDDIYNSSNVSYVINKYFDNDNNTLSMPSTSSGFDINATSIWNQTELQYGYLSRHRGNNVIYLECFATETMLFEMIDQYPLGGLMNILAGIGIVTYFVTSSDSASHVIDVLTANGNEEPPKLQRIFWAMSEGAVASVLLSAGGSDALAALQTVSIASGLPFCAILLSLCYAFWFALKVDSGEINLDERESWVFDYLDSTNPQLTFLATPEPRSDILISWIKSVLLPCLEQWNNYNILLNKDKSERVFSNGQFSRAMWAFMFFVFPFLTVLCWCLGFAFDGWGFMGWTFYTFFIFIAAWNRGRIRQYYGIGGSSLCDLLAYLCCLYPWAITQETQQVNSNKDGVDLAVQSKSAISRSAPTEANSNKNIELAASAPADDNNGDAGNDTSGGGVNTNDAITQAFAE